MRKNEVDFENNIKNIIENDAGLINEMVKFPKIMKGRLCFENKAVISRPPENVLELLNSKIFNYIYNVKMSQKNIKLNLTHIVFSG